MTKAFSLKDVKSLCTYKTRTGSLVWVGECSAGYFYGRVDYSGFVHFVPRLILCFRFMPTVENGKPDAKLSHLRVANGEPIPPALADSISVQLAHLSSSRQFLKKKDPALPFNLTSYKVS